MTAKKYLLLIPASFGYIFPAIKIALILQRRGHQVQVVSDCAHGSLFKLYSIPFVGVHQTVGPLPFMAQNEWFAPQANQDQVRIFQQAIEAYQPDALISSALTISATIVAERFKLPLIMIGFGTYLYPKVGQENDTAVWRIGDIVQHHNQIRQMFNLAPLSTEANYEHALLGDCYLLRSLPALTGSAEGFPPQVKQVGALYFEPAYTNVALEQFITTHKAQNKPLVYVQIGRLFDNRPVWDNLMSQLSQLPYGFIVDLGRADYFGQIDSTSEDVLPENLFADDFIPLGKVATDITAVICSGTTTVVMGALLHARPVISLPTSADGIEFTELLVEKGLGVGIMSSESVTVESLQQALETLAGDAAIANNLLQMQQQLKAFDNEDELGEHLESVLAPQTEDKALAHRVTVMNYNTERVCLEKSLGAIMEETPFRHRFLARDEWQPLNPEEQTTLLPDSQPPFLTSIVLFEFEPRFRQQFQQEILEPVQQSQIDQAEAERRMLALTQAAFPDLSFDRVLSTSLVVKPANTPTTAFDAKTNEYVGLHIDNYFDLPFDRREEGVQLLVTNVGQAERYFHFIDLTVAGMLHKLQTTPEVRLPSTIDELVNTFFEHFPTYPIYRIRLQPGQAYLALTHNFIHDGATNTQTLADMAIFVGGSFSLQ